MKRLLFIALLFVFGLPLGVSGKVIILRVKGVEIGTRYATVLQKLGKPVSNKKGGSYPCDDGQVITLRYPGLIIKLIEDNDKKHFFVASMEVTSPKWQVAPGIGIGATLKKVQAKFGAGNPTKENGLKNLSYGNTDGYMNFYFRHSKLVRIAWELNTC